MKVIAHLHICKEEEGYSAIVANLPGCGSCGSTPEETIANVREAVRATVESYIPLGIAHVPWVHPPDCPFGYMEKRITVEIGEPS